MPHKAQERGWVKMAIKKQVVIACDVCNSSLTYHWNSGFNTNVAIRGARGKGWQVGKQGVYCPHHRPTKNKEKAASLSEADGSGGSDGS